MRAWRVPGWLLHPDMYLGTVSRSQLELQLWWGRASISVLHLGLCVLCLTVVGQLQVPPAPSSHGFIQAEGKQL